jgi:hypothetical protein
VYVNGCGCDDTPFADNAAVAVSTHVVLLASFASVAAVSAVVAVVVVAVVACKVVYEAVLTAVSFASGVAVISSLGDDDFVVVVLAFRTFVLDAVNTAFTAAMFAFSLNAFSRHFFLLLRLPCPGPGIAE